MADALGTGSGYRVPLVPESEPFRELFAVVRREALAPFAWAIAEAFRCEKDIEIRVGSLTTVVTAADVRRALAAKLEEKFSQRLDVVQAKHIADREALLAAADPEVRAMVEAEDG